MKANEHDRIIVSNDPVNFVDPLGLRWYTGAGQINNNSGGPITVTGDTKGGSEGSVTIPDGGSHNFNKDWIDALTGDGFEGKLVDPDFIHYPDGTIEKIKPFPWDTIDVPPNPNDIDGDGIPNSQDPDYTSPKNCPIT